MIATAKELLKDATPEQIRWVVARLSAKTDAAAAKKAGVHPSSVSRWENKIVLDQAVLEMLMEPAAAAMEILQVAVVEAAQIKVDGLSSKSAIMKQNVASEILDRVTGKAIQPISGSINVDIEVDKALIKIYGDSNSGA